jgi:hypothetical protein
MGLVDNYKEKKELRATKKACKLPNDQEKLEALEDIKDEKNRTEVICSLESDDLKLELISKITNKDFQCKIISSLKSDEEKIKYLDSHQEDFYELGPVVLTLNTYELVKEYSKKFLLYTLPAAEMAVDKRLEELRPEYEKRQARLAKKRENNQHTQKNSTESKELNDMSIEELEAESSKLDSTIQANSQEISDSERKMQLIVDVTTKRATIAKQNEQIAQLHHQINLQPAKSQQIGD